ncbi:MAG: hypothetical protein IPN87_17615 [Saprospiraceae bacterium]|nr:hypothetical protein [Candidatus Brachybacter algidus]
MDEYVGFAIGGDANSSTILKTTDKGEAWSEELLLHPDCLELSSYHSQQDTLAALMEVF